MNTPANSCPEELVAFKHHDRDFAVSATLVVGIHRHPSRHPSPQSVSFVSFGFACGHLMVSWANLNFGLRLGSQVQPPSRMPWTTTVRSDYNKVPSIREKSERRGPLFLRLTTRGCEKEYRCDHPSTEQAAGGAIDVYVRVGYESFKLFL